MEEALRPAADEQCADDRRWIWCSPATCAATCTRSMRTTARSCGSSLPAPVRAAVRSAMRSKAKQYIVIPTGLGSHAPGFLAGAFPEIKNASGRCGADRLHAGVRCCRSLGLAMRGASRRQSRSASAAIDEARSRSSCCGFQLKEFGFGSLVHSNCRLSVRLCHYCQRGRCAAPPFDLDDTARVEAGRARFGANCAAYCHGFEGSGGKTPAFRGRQDLVPAEVFKVITEGRKGADVMPAWGRIFRGEALGVGRLHHVPGEIGSNSQACDRTGGK